MCLAIPRAVSACRYPPAGVRGITTGGRGARFGRASSYLKEADREICVLVQVETMTAIDQIEAIAAVDGVDGIFVGPSDLDLPIADSLYPERWTRG